MKCESSELLRACFCQKGGYNFRALKVHQRNQLFGNNSYCFGAILRVFQAGTFLHMGIMGVVALMSQRYVINYSIIKSLGELDGHEIARYGI